MKSIHLLQMLKKAAAHRLYQQRGLAWYVQRANVNEAALRTSYNESPLKDARDNFALIRILGNDLYPRHKKGQTFQNLQFILTHESNFEDCHKHWILNRIACPDQVARLKELLEAHQQTYECIPYDPVAYQEIPRDYSCLPKPDYLQSKHFRALGKKAQIDAIAATYWKKNNYVMNNNGARNRALELGRSVAKWVLPWDGNCFLNDQAWRDLSIAIRKRPHYRHFLCPMARINDNASLLYQSPAPATREEPQLIFRNDFKSRFNEAYCYGRRPKVEMFWTLGVPGPWDSWADAPWDPKRRPPAEDAYGFAIAGWVARIASGMPMQEKSSWMSAAYRAIRRQEAIIETLEYLDQNSSRAS